MRKALLSFVLLTCLGSCCGAQTAARQAQTVIVIDFENKSTSNDPSLIRLATDTVAAELANSGQFIVLTREEVSREAGRLGLKPPYDRIALSKLSAALGATAYVTGEISFVRETKKKGARSVEVGLKVRVHEADSGELIGGATVVASKTR